jgi:hypothetical protein
MKYRVTLGLAMLAVSAAFAFSFSGQIKSRTIPEAYQIATQTLGSRTNELVCVEAERSKKYKGLWSFTFEGTNVSQVVVWVSDIQPEGSIDGEHK